MKLTGAKEPERHRLDREQQNPAEPENPGGGSGRVAELDDRPAVNKRQQSQALADQECHAKAQPVSEPSVAGMWSMGLSHNTVSSVLK